MKTAICSDIEDEIKQEAVRPAGPCGDLLFLGAVLQPGALGQALRDGGEEVFRVGGALDVIGAVLVDQIEAVLRLAGERMRHRRGIVGKAGLVRIGDGNRRPFV